MVGARASDGWPRARRPRLEALERAPVRPSRAASGACRRPSSCRRRGLRSRPDRPLRAPSRWRRGAAGHRTPPSARRWRARPIAGRPLAGGKRSCSTVGADRALVEARGETSGTAPAAQTAAQSPRRAIPRARVSVAPFRRSTPSDRVSATLAWRMPRRRVGCACAALRLRAGRASGGREGRSTPRARPGFAEP